MERHFLRKFASDEQGAVAIEYGLIASLIAVALIPVLDAVGLAVHDTFEDIGRRMRGR